MWRSLRVGSANIRLNRFHTTYQMKYYEYHFKGTAMDTAVIIFYMIHSSELH